MNAFEKFTYLIAASMDTPPLYGWFHLMMFALIIVSTVLLVVKYKDCSDEIFRRIMLISWIINVVLEIYVGLMFSFSSDGTSAVWSYAWYMFPFQFCSSPIYVLPFIAFMRDGRIRDCFISFTISFTVFGGMAVMFYPGDVFMWIIGINIQTMIHHGMMGMLGVFCAVHERRKLSFRHALRGVPVFAALASVALTLNVVTHHLRAAVGADDLFNLFYISPYQPCTLPILADIYPVVPYPVFLAIYILGFSLVAFAVYYIQKAIIALVMKKSRSKKSTV